jgi:lipopolysaccharide/colanic/teichoic acid biosynthesis glycosyltransferase
VKLVPECFGCDPAPVVFQKYGNVPVLTLSKERVPIFQLLVKRGIDVMLSVVGLLLSLPILAITYCAIRLDSSGPALYRAPRLGLKGRRFLCFKFRTMVANADALKQKLRAHNQRKGAFFKIVDDPRVTQVGRVLRRYSLDELPQLWNVLRGDMSMVGPRPHPVDDFERYDLEDLQRLDVLPGITGLWQVTARSDPSFARNMALDREYIGRWTLSLDFRILFKTVVVVWRGEGA